MSHLKQNNFHAIHYITSLNYCYVCGFNNESNLIHGEICPCCFTEWGFDEHQQSKDYSTLTEENIFIESIYLLRKDWIEKGAVFDDEDFKPADWSKEKAIQQIKDNVPEELWENDPLVNGRE